MPSKANDQGNQENFQAIKCGLESDRIFLEQTFSLEKLLNDKLLGRNEKNIAYENLTFHGCSILSEKTARSINSRVKVRNLNFSSVMADFSVLRIARYFELMHIKSLTLSNCGLKSIDNFNWMLMKNLQHLNLSLNQISNFSALKIFSSSSFSLRNIEIQGNPFESIEKLISCLSGIKTLKSLSVGFRSGSEHLDANKSIFDKFFENVPNLVEIDKYSRVDRRLERPGSSEKNKHNSLLAIKENFLGFNDQEFKKKWMFLRRNWQKILISTKLQFQYKRKLILMKTSKMCDARLNRVFLLQINLKGSKNPSRL